MTERYGWDQTPTPDLGLDITKAPSDIQKLYKWVMEKMYGEDVASAYGQGIIAAGIIAKNAEAMSLFTSGQMDTLDTFVRDTLIELTDKDIISAPEIIASRDGAPTLSDRLSRDFGAIDNSILNMSLNVRNPLNYGVVNDGTNTQEALNNLEEGFEYYFPPGVYGVKGYSDDSIYVGNGFRPKSNTIYSFHPQAIIKVLDNSHRIYHAISLHGQKNLILKNPNILGDRDNHIIPPGGDTHEWGHGIHIGGDTQVKIYNPTISNTHGDGIDIYAFEGSDIEIYYPKIKRARRNGISVESVDRLRIYYPEIDDTNGTLPEAGIDFEPFNDKSPATAIMRDIIVHEPTIRNSASTGLAFTFLGNTVNKFYDITINGGVFDGVKTSEIAPLNTGKVVFNLPRIHGGGHGIHEVNSYTNFTYNEPSILIDKSRNPGTKSAYYVIRMAGYANWTGFTTIHNMRFLNEATDNLDVIGVDLEIVGQPENSITNLDISVLENRSIGRGLKNYKHLNVVNSIFSKIPNAIKPHTENVMFGEMNMGNTLTNLGATKALTFQLNNPGNLASLRSPITIEVMSEYNVHLFGDTTKFLPYNKSTLILSGIGNRCVVEPIKIGSTTYLMVTESNGTITPGST